MVDTGYVTHVTLDTRGGEIPGVVFNPRNRMEPGSPFFVCMEKKGEPGDEASTKSL